MSKGLWKNTTTSEEPDGENRATGFVGEQGPDMMAMFRVLMEEQRRSEIAREEARRQEDERKEEARVEREIETTRKQLEQQAALETGQYEQQVALMKIQAEIGEASKVHSNVALVN